MHNLTRERSFVAVAILLIMMAGCGIAPAQPTLVPPTSTPVPPTSTPVPPTERSASAVGGPVPTAEAGWVVYDMSAKGFAIALPEEWEQIDLDPQTISATIEFMQKQNPEMAKMVEGIASSVLQSGGSFFAFDLGPDSASTGMVANLNVLQQDMGTAPSLDFVVQLSAGQLENLSSVVPPVEHEIIDLPAGEAGVMRYKLNMNKADGTPVTVLARQYVLIKGTVLYILSMGAPAELEETYLPVFDKIAQTFRITR